MTEHYFTDEPTSDSPLNHLTVNIFGDDYDVVTQGGVFSPSGLDKGTAVLLDKVPVTELPSNGVALDIGCGWGPITMALCATYPHARVIGVDVNERARDLAAANLETHEMSAAIFAPDDASAQLKDTGIDLIWSNPPIRIGKAALHDLLRHWLGFLKPDGDAFFVVQKNLGADSLATWLTAQGWPTSKIASSKGFRILHTRMN